MTKRQHLIFHIESDDYFGSLASILFAQQELMGGILSYEDVQKTLRRITKDLVFLQKNYRIVPKEKNTD